MLKKVNGNGLGGKNINKIELSGLQPTFTKRPWQLEHITTLEKNRRSEPIRRKFIDQRLVVCLSSEKMRKIAKGLQNFFNGPRCVHSAENLNSILEKKLL